MIMRLRVELVDGMSSRPAGERTDSIIFRIKGPGWSPKD